MKLFLLLLFIAFARAQYVINATEGCADISVTLPGPFSILRIDQIDYKFDGDTQCSKTLDATDTVDCSLTDQGDGTYLATARVCDVEDHVWAGFRMDEYMQHKRYGYVTVYFSQGGTYTNIENNCIQPTLSSPAEIDAVGLYQVEIVCARHDKCTQGPFSTIFTAADVLCNDYGYPKCTTEMKGEMRLLKVTFKRPKNEDKSFVFCSTLDSFLSYVVKWT